MLIPLHVPGVVRCLFLGLVGLNVLVIVLTHCWGWLWFANALAIAFLAGSWATLELSSAQARRYARDQD